MAVEPLLAVLGAAIFALAALAAVSTAVIAGRGHWPWARKLRPGHQHGEPVPEVRHRVAAKELEEILRGSYAAETFNMVTRVVAWSSILIVLLIVGLSQLWQPVQPQIMATLILAGIFALVVQERMPLGRLARARVIVEGSAAIVILTMLVLLTGNSASPFFFLYVLLIGAMALLTSRAAALTLTVEAAIAYTVAVFTGPLDAAASREAFTRVAINLVALVFVAYAGMVVARVQRRTHDAAIRLSTLDALTELYNRAFLFNAVDREINRAQRFGRGFCLLMMDLDGLKGINDLYGHHQGDVVLRGVAQIIRTNVRLVDVAARYGGDEFVAILPETDPTGANVVAEKIRQTTAELVVRVGGRRTGASLSIGVVAYPDDGHTADELMLAADAAMYSAKRAGKNRVMGYAEPRELPEPRELSDVRGPHAGGALGQTPRHLPASPDGATTSR